MADQLQKFDIAIAYKALALAPGISGAGIKVGAAIIDHHNRKTGRCDPSVDRLATLLDMNGATVRRATNELVAGGLFKKKSHGGRFGTVAYTPRWDRFRSIVLDWNTRMRNGEGPERRSSKRARMRGSTAQECAVDARKNARQTYLSNQAEEPSPVVPPQCAGAHLDNTQAPKGSKGLGGKEVGTSRQGWLVHALPGGKSVSHAEAAQTAQERRLHKAILDLPTPEEREAAWLAVGARE